MSDEIVFAANTLSPLANVVIVCLGVYRSRQFYRSFIDPVYKSHARWLGFLLGVILISNLNNFVPYNTNTSLGNFLSFVTFPAIVGVVFAYVDRTILVAVRTDFFHRDTLHWGRVRRPAAVLLGCSIVVTLLLSWFVPTNPPLWALICLYEFFLVTIVTLGYGAVALVIGARRTADRTFRRHVLLLGMALAAFVCLVGSFFIPGEDAQAVVSACISTGSLYILYRAVMSLSPLDSVTTESE